MRTTVQSPYRARPIRFCCAKPYEVLFVGPAPHDLRTCRKRSLAIAQIAWRWNSSLPDTSRLLFATFYSPCFELRGVPTEYPTLKLGGQVQIFPHASGQFTVTKERTNSLLELLGARPLGDRRTNSHILLCTDRIKCRNPSLESRFRLKLHTLSFLNLSRQEGFGDGCPTSFVGKILQASWALWDTSLFLGKRRNRYAVSVFGPYSALSNRGAVRYHDSRSSLSPCFFRSRE